MKIRNILSILGGIILTSAASSTVVSCNAPSVNEYNYPNFSYIPKNTEDGSNNAFANDPTTILWDDSTNQYYSWEVFRNGHDFGSNWIEMTSPDMKTWTQTKERIVVGKDVVQNKDNYWGKNNIPFIMGGSVWIDKNAKFKDKGISDEQPGDVIFLVSIPPCKVFDPKTKSYETIDEDAGIAYFVSHGLGQDFYQSGVLSEFCHNDGLSGWNNLDGKNPDELDQSKVPNQNWRDPDMFENKNGDLDFAISAGGHIEFWTIKSFVKEEKDNNKPIYRNFYDPNYPEGLNLQNGNDNERLEKDKTMNDIDVFKGKYVGVEVPNVLKIGKDNNGELIWFISCSMQGAALVDNDRKNKDFDKETSMYKIGKFDLNGNFKTINNSDDFNLLEYGTESYSQRINDPYQQEIAAQNTIVSRSMPYNWAYTFQTNHYSWDGGAYPTDTINFDLEKGLAIQTTLEAYNPINKKDYKIESLDKYDKNSGTAVYELMGKDFLNKYSLNFNEYGTFEISGKLDDADAKSKDKNINLSWLNNVNTNLDKWTTKGGLTNENDKFKIVWNKAYLVIYNITKGWNAHFMLTEGITHTPNKNAVSWNTSS